MDTLFTKLQEYLQMEEEISFDEFSQYYKNLLHVLNTSFADFNHDECIKVRYICTIVQTNAESRSKSSKINAKAFKKIQSKCGFWVDAINYRLLKEGKTQQEIDEATMAINDIIL
ncbi:MAG: hypothetical protein ACYDEJ_00555 [Desulfitobacteriaceae bacterium]